MQFKDSFLILILLVGVICLAGCTNSAATTADDPIATPTLPPVYSAEKQTPHSTYVTSVVTNIVQPSTTTPITIAPTAVGISQDFSSMALTINDLPQGWMMRGQPNQTTTMYQSKFVYLTGSVGVPLTFTIMKYPTANDAKLTFNQKKSAITNVRVDSLNIGDEGFDYQRVSVTDITFRRGNLIITLSTIAYPPLDVSDLQPFADLVNSRISG